MGVTGWRLDNPLVVLALAAKADCYFVDPSRWSVITSTGTSRVLAGSLGLDLYHDLRDHPFF